jgi:hypothetical protein
VKDIYLLLGSEAALADRALTKIIAYLQVMYLLEKYLMRYRHRYFQNVERWSCEICKIWLKKQKLKLPDISKAQIPHLL